MEIDNIEIEEDSITHKKEVLSSYIGESCIFEDEGDGIELIKDLFDNINEEDIEFRYSGRMHYCTYDDDDYKEKVDIVILEKNGFFFIFGRYKGHDFCPFDTKI